MTGAVCWGVVTGTTVVEATMLQVLSEVELLCKTVLTEVA